MLYVNTNKKHIMQANYVTCREIGGKQNEEKDNKRN